MNRQKAALAVLVILLICSVIYAVIRSPRQREATPQELQRARAAASRPRTVPPAARRPGTAAPAAPTPGTAAPAASQQGGVELALLDREPPRYVAPSRDIFSPIFREEVKLPPFKPLPPLPPPRPLGQANVPPPPPAPAPPPPTPEQLAEAEMRNLAFLGYLKKNGNKTVFLSYKDQILLAKKGATLANKFVVKDITDEAITLKPVIGGNELVIPLADNRPLPRQAGRSR
ncbi:type II secretion system protein PulP [Geomonas sp.]|uniref:type II secretion system protein PulP n=1 Tax=Geomonas sp. TaxID=2651584 RepID=UPI002B46EF11|nr:type II secretion system protein PulP [Geomonas sp.]HJV34093.1 type II secretion system protein PulP [Geomonas sp.]